MSLASNVVRRSGSARYYARLGVPPDLQPILNRRELWKSLNTADPREARDRALPILIQWRSTFADLRKRRSPSDNDLQKLTWDHYQRGLKADHAERDAMPNAAQIEISKRTLLAAVTNGSQEAATPLASAVAVAEVARQAHAPKHAQAARAAELAVLRKHVATGEPGSVAWIAEALIQQEALLVEPGSPAFIDLCRRLQRARIEVLKRAEERDAGDWTGKPADPVVAPAEAVMGREYAKPGETIMELYDRFKVEKAGTANADTWQMNRTIVKLFAEFVGEASAVSVITRKAVRDWKHALALWPVKANEMVVFRGMAFRQIIEKNATVGKQPISPRTVNKYLSAVGTFAEWLLSNEYIEQDVMRGMYLDEDKREQKRYPFSDKQLKQIFGSPLFHACRGDKKEHLPGNVEIRDWRYWIPLIALYSGARLGEIAQLLTADVRQLHGIWIMHITAEGSDAKSVKTAGSARVVPLHSKLIELGFLKYHAGIQKRGAKRLFPEIRPDARGFISGDASTFFNDYFRAIGVKKDRKVSFHSFRHGMADAFRRAGYLDEQFGMLLGHTKATTTGRYGILPQGLLAERQKMIEAVTFSEYPLVATTKQPAATFHARI